MPPNNLRLEADRIGTFVWNMTGVVGGVIAVVLGGYITQKLTTVPQMALAGAGTAVIAGFFAFYREKKIGLAWIELDDVELAVGIKHATYRIRWAEMTTIVQKFDPEEVWRIYTKSPSPALTFDPSTLSPKDLKAMREFMKVKAGIVAESSSANGARNSKK